ncbi:S-adenosylmethionine:tRNA ribosyltransferase-isomerase [Hazenella coriacea]|uniref:S-adenosylmethionine--tRNA ribosyltransferase-isomerase n=1 Tax=Hazenella coriacea TaxID=1179467 RepID=A0A4R3LEV0_9BACL|nr:S-adenosylmethionine:tRNA ribosyltransferase-isomerase [Hazenella coriacea]TCS95986.1 S-adenosylmethionine--tRNA ribosyltransferase-isomerase [Hazenella coriacea]
MVTIPFSLPNELNADSPPERRGIRRDHVRMMVSDLRSGESQHVRFFDLPQMLKTGDVVVLNASRTVPAVLYVDQMRDGKCISLKRELRLAHRIDHQTWDVWIVGDQVQQGDELIFSDKLTAIVTQTDFSFPLVQVQFSLSGAQLFEQIYSLGDPVRYEYIKQPWSLDYYQTVYASVPGSVEIPSAGRAFSWELIFRLREQGIQIVTLTLHTGLSYFHDDLPFLSPEQNSESYEIPEYTALTINHAKQHGGRVIAVGTTVVRALESAAKSDKVCLARRGKTNLKITEETPLQIADGLITGFHEPEASHLDLLSAFVEPSLLKKMYEEAIQQRYLWHEFGDIHLIL